tara:strand:+ start:491 stop:775 length:285 start_codon:yes stop_codon:yes gene_type:complete
LALNAEEGIMEHLAKATIHALMFFELVEDDVLDPDTALRLSESIISELENSTDEEKSELFRVCRKLVEKERNGLNREEVIAFLEGFNESYLPNY